ncbi:hypothetical protein [Streptomyces atratus]|uniref:hypothetical protein n=1 Tax=Streptomyces atratus TaxID=1893 RepID=UPI00364DCFE6
MLNNLNSQQFTAPTSTNAAGTSANGQGTSRPAASAGKSGGTTTVISIKGSTPSISTRA